MGYQTSPMHGKNASLFRYRPNGFKGVGLNDATWGTGYSDAGNTADFEVVIDAEGTPDTFKWRKNGGGWTATVNCDTGAVTLSDSQTILWAANTGHTLADQWVVGNLDTEATSEVGAAAQITEATHRLLLPQKTIAWTDDGGETVMYTEFAAGKAHFTDTVGAVTVSGNNTYIIPSGLDQIGYLTGWTLNVNLDVAEANRCGQPWKEVVPGQAGASGTAEAFLIMSDSFFNDMYESIIDVDEPYYLLELYLYDLSQDQTGDSIKCWVSFNSWGTGASVSDTVKENVSFTVHGIPSAVES